MTTLRIQGTLPGSLLLLRLERVGNERSDLILPGRGARRDDVEVTAVVNLENPDRLPLRRGSRAVPGSRIRGQHGRRERYSRVDVGRFSSGDATRYRAGCWLGSPPINGAMTGLPQTSASKPTNGARSPGPSMAMATAVASGWVEPTSLSAGRLGRDAIHKAACAPAECPTTATLLMSSGCVLASTAR